MKRRSVLISVLALACSVSFCAVIAQRNKLLDLRGQEQRRFSKGRDDSVQMRVIETAPASAGMIVPGELLRLRNQVNLLTHRKMELEGIRSENERLRLQFAQRQTNPPVALPPGYIRMSQARPVGYSTPADTLQSLLWALQHRDATNVLLAFTPEEANWLQSQAQGSFEKLFGRYEGFFGFSIVRTKDLNNETVQELQADIELAPGLHPISINLRKVGDEWKIESLPF